MNKKHPALMIIMAAVFTGCATIPEGAAAVGNLEKEKYLGTWYEIARYDSAFEKNLINTTAEYTLQKNGFIGVTNRGYNIKKDKWQEVNGKAKFRREESKGELLVSFFGPFYGAYNIIALDKDYKYAMVAGSSTKYLWILSRTKEIPEEIRQEYISIAESVGYDTEKLVWVEQN